MKKFEDKTKFGKFLSRASSKGLNVISAIGKAKDGDFIGAFEDVKKVLSKDPQNDGLLSELIKKKSEFKSDYDKYLEDIKDARDMYTDTGHKMADQIAGKVINQNLPIIFSLIIINVLSVWLLKGQGEIIAIVSNFIGIAIGHLFNERQSIINFFFGSSRGSKDKSKLLNK